MKMPNLPMQRGKAAFTLIEMLVVIVISVVIMGAVVSLWIFSARSFTAIGNYNDLDSKSRYAIDSMLRDMREATLVTAYASNSTSMTVTITNSQSASSGTTYTWDSTSRNLVRQKTGEADKTFLTECDLWNVQLYQRTPLTNGTFAFYPATNSSGVLDTTICKLINMNWKCSRTILGSKLNTENVQTAQVVLRNKQ